MADGDKTAAQRLQAEWNAVAAEVDPKRIPKSALTILQWIYNNSGTPPTKLLPADIPGLGALRHLQLIQSSTAEYSAFVNSIWSKTIPSRAEIDRAAKEADDGGELLDLLDEFDDELPLDSLTAGKGST